MTSARIAEAKKLYAAQDKTFQEIADIFGVSRPNIYRAVEKDERFHFAINSHERLGISMSDGSSPDEKAPPTAAQLHECALERLTGDLEWRLVTDPAEIAASDVRAKELGVIFPSRAATVIARDSE